MAKGTILKVLNPSVKSGTSEKNGKTFQWNLMEVEITKEDGAIIKARGFDVVADGDEVEITEKPYEGKDGKTYMSWNYNLPKRSFSSGTDQREVLEAIRMTYKLVKQLEEKVDQLLGIDAVLGAEKSPDNDMPADFLVEDAKAPARDWASVGKPKVEETYVEPLPEEPGDLESFMNG